MNMFSERDQSETADTRGRPCTTGPLQPSCEPANNTKRSPPGLHGIRLGYTYSGERSRLPVKPKQIPHCQATEWPTTQPQHLEHDLSNLTSPLWLVQHDQSVTTGLLQLVQYDLSNMGGGGGGERAISCDVSRKVWSHEFSSQRHDLGW